MSNPLLSLANKRKKLDSSNFLLFVTICLFVAMYILGIIIYHDVGFGRTQIFLNMLIDNAGLLIAASGMTMVMITGGIDISVGSVIGLVCMILSYSMERMGFNALTSIAIVLLFGVVFGAFQGWLVSYMELQPFIITLAGLFGCRGITAIISSEQIAITKSEGFLAFAKVDINLPSFLGYYNRRGNLIVPFIHPSVIIAVITVFIMWYVLKYTRFGRNLYAIGGNEQSAKLMGLPVARTKILVYAFNGFCSVLAGFAYVLYVKSGWNLALSGGELEVITCAVIGGTLMTGGVGYMIGTLFGVLLKSAIPAIITFNGNLLSWWGKIATGVLLLLFIFIQRVVVLYSDRKKQE